mgnify:CR=1 FL=1
MESAEQRLLLLISRLQHLIQADANAYAGVIQAYRLPKTDPSRATAISANLMLATRVPLETAELAREAASRLRALLMQAKPSVASDLRVGLLMALAAIQGGLENVRANLKYIRNQLFTEDILRRVNDIEQSLVELKGL